MVRRARESKGKFERLAERVAARFVPIVTVIGVATFVGDWAYGSLERGLLAALSVALIACPCALGLAAPLAIWSALGHAARQQVLFRGGDALERLADIKAVRFDKTGTLTDGTSTVSRYLTSSNDDSALILEVAAELAKASSHAMSRAVVACALERAGADWERTALVAIRVVPGRGVVGTRIETGDRVVFGSARFLSEERCAVPSELEGPLENAESRGLPVTLIGWAGRIRGLFVFEERSRPLAPGVIDWLKRQSLDVRVLTGDHAARGRIIARCLGVAVDAEMLPDQKVAAIQQARSAIGPVAMVGDGINDAPALSASDVGIALGCGTDVSRDSASVCLLGNDLSRIPWSIELARRTRRVILWNLIWSFGYNGVGVAFASLGWLNPALAAFLMVASGSIVTVNSLRLGRPFDVEIARSSFEQTDCPVGFGPENGDAPWPELLDSVVMEASAR
jgi:heavy metal translocating P-type ATPase